MGRTRQTLHCVLLGDLAPGLRTLDGCSARATPSRRNGHKLKETCALKRRMLVRCWLSVLLIQSVFALGLKTAEGMPSPGPIALGQQQLFADQLSAAYSPEESASIVALPATGSAHPSSPMPGACANNAAELAQSEWTSGKKLAADVERHVSLITDPGITEYLSRLEQAIVQSSHLRGCFVVKLVNDVEVNAYSLPGGFLYVTAGLILNADSEAQLIAALAHETGHVAARHFSKIEARRRIWGRLSMAGGPAGYALRWRLGPLFTLKLLRNAEFEADRLGLSYQSAAGYDPIEFAQLLEVFQQPGTPGSFFARLFDEHPSTETRIKRMRQATSRLQNFQMDYVVDTSEFHEIKKHVASVMKVTNPDSLPH
jgi:predicted Zn-dependent protease